jgi:hypothetical protein
MRQGGRDRDRDRGKERERQRQRQRETERERQRGAVIHREIFDSEKVGSVAGSPLGHVRSHPSLVTVGQRE